MLKKMIWVLALLSMMLTLVACGGETVSAEQEPQEEQMQEEEMQDVEMEDDVGQEAEIPQEDLASEQEVELQDWPVDYDAIEIDGSIPAWDGHEGANGSTSDIVSMLDDIAVVEVDGVKRIVSVSDIADVYETATTTDDFADLNPYLELWLDVRLSVMSDSFYDWEDADFADDVPYLYRWERYWALHGGYYEFGPNLKEVGMRYIISRGSISADRSSEMLPPLLIKHNSVDQSERIIVKTSGKVEDVFLVPVQDVGYTISVNANEHGLNYEPGIIVEDRVNNERYNLLDRDESISQFEIRNAKTGKEISPIEVVGWDEVSNVEDLGYGTKWIASWFEGTEYREVKLVAKDKIYKKSDEGIIVLPYNLTKEGYAEYYYSDVPAGKYALSVGSAAGAEVVVHII